MRLLGLKTVEPPTTHGKHRDASSLTTASRPWRLGLIALLIVASAGIVFAQGRRFRRHTANEAHALKLVPANQAGPGDSRVEIDPDHGHRHVESNAIPEHAVGRFPNPGNPNTIRAQRHELRFPLDPEVASEVTSLMPPGRRGPPIHVFGVAVNGVTFEPGAGEFWQGRPRSGWQYEPLGGAISLGLDANHAHVQPTGKYHYHGLPIGLMERLGQEPGRHSPLIGWAADGFPIYAQYGYADPEDAASEIVELHSSYRLKEGTRPSGDEGPGGTYDGAFVRDYEYVEGVGELDECNGRTCVTPEFPDGTYAYFLTSDWPVIPRAFRGTPADERRW